MKVVRFQLNNLICGPQFAVVSKTIHSRSHVLMSV